MKENEGERISTKFETAFEGADQTYIDTLNGSGAYDTYYFSDYDKYCPVLKEGMRRELGGLSLNDMSCLGSNASLSDFAKNMMSIAERVVTLTPQSKYRALVTSKRCTACHDPSGFDIGPPIPFLSDTDMRVYLAKHPDFLTKLNDRTDDHADVKFRMPKAGAALTPVERSAIVNYIGAMVPKK